MCQIISVHSFRGGTGKSNLTANLAATMALQGLKVGVVDTDIQSPGIHIIFGLDEDHMNYALNDYLWGNCQIEDTAYDVSRVLSSEEINGSLYLIPSSIKAGQIARILREGYDVARLNDGLNELIQGLDLDYLLIDTHPGLNEETLLSIAISDRLVVILRPDRQDYQGTAVTLEVARKLEMSNIMLVVNKALPHSDFDILQQNMETTYKSPVVGIIPLSEEIVQLGSRDIFCLHYPHHPLSLTVANITAQIVQEKQMLAVGG
ncbi:Cobyrinic acid a,c-diamide synthase [Hyella patelloides LEGE 07179]|uniref:Cobyrinic acid a,c-diamide synthase n=1 Tax=Hyella patelloides LEGE 07179 TaxID=945734 RepID=A0A563W507_9CYAN|nr:MinD/ParA family protein [Hyella patelloides]VEP18758.1 Cobyrinic acid a,c-diamide synthase [Hyella patelloides LEGE 07179]